MSINVESTSDSKEAVTAAMSDLAKQPEKEPKDEPKEEPKESPEVPEEEIQEPNEGEEELEAKEEKPKKKGGFQRKLEKKDQMISTLEQEKEYWRQEALRKAQAQEAKPQVDNSKKPNPNDFKTADEYTEALIDWKADQKFMAKENESRIKAQQQETQTLIQKHQDRVAEFSETVDDWDELINSVKVPMSITVQQAIIESEVGPEIMYELAKNPGELKRISGLSAVAAAKAIGKLEDKFEAKSKEPVQETKTTKSVPKPVKTVRSGSTPVMGYRDDMSMKDYEALRRQERKQRNA